MITAVAPSIAGFACYRPAGVMGTVNTDVASLHASPVAETVDNVRRQQGWIETSPGRSTSPAGYQWRHDAKEKVS